MKYIIAIFCLIINFNSFSQENFPDKIFLSSGDTLVCKVNFINAKIVYLTNGVLKRNGKRKPKNKNIELAYIKDIKLGDPTEVADKNYSKLLNKFNKKFYDLKCEPLILKYDKRKDEVISESRVKLSSDIESTTYLGVSVINGKKFLTISKVIYMNTGVNYDIPKGSKVSLHLEDSSKIEFKTDSNFKLIHNTKLIATGNYYYQGEIKEYRTGSILKVTIPITDKKLLELSKVNFNLITIVDVDGKIRKFSVNPDRIDSSIKGCLCGLNMN